MRRLLLLLLLPFATLHAQTDIPEARIREHVRYLASEKLTGRRTEEPERAEVVEELLWTMDRAEEHLGGDRANRYLRKFYPWYVERLGGGPELTDALHRSADLAAARRLIRAQSTPVASL